MGGGPNRPKAHQVGARENLGKEQTQRLAVLLEGYLPAAASAHCQDADASPQSQMIAAGAVRRVSRLCRGHAALMAATGVEIAAIVEATAGGDCRPWHSGTVVAAASLDNPLDDSLAGLLQAANSWQRTIAAAADGGRKGALFQGAGALAGELAAAPEAVNEHGDMSHAAKVGGPPHLGPSGAAFQSCAAAAAVQLSTHYHCPHCA